MTFGVSSGSIAMTTMSPARKTLAWSVGFVGLVRKVGDELSQKPIKKDSAE
jgi:hypothetical protein